MAIDKESNGFTFGFAVIMVVVVGALLSVTAMSLKPFQNENIKREKMQDILGAAQIKTDRENAPELFQQYIAQRYLLNYEGELISEESGEIKVENEEDPFNVDVKLEFRSLPKEKRRYPLFIFENEGQRLYIIPLVGKGLWGPIWGFIALEEDFNSVFGATFGHKTETPGLGAEIADAEFQDQFPSQTIFDEKGNFVSIRVMKGGVADKYPHAVDGITGGTITSVGVQEMLERTLQVYVRYYKKHLKEKAS